MPENTFWLYEWMNTYKIQDFHDAERLLTQTGPLKDLQERAERVPYTTERITASNVPTIVAGRAIDLSGEYS